MGVRRAERTERVAAAPFGRCQKCRYSKRRNPPSLPTWGKKITLLSAYKKGTRAGNCGGGGNPSRSSKWQGGCGRASERGTHPPRSMGKGGKRGDASQKVKGDQLFMHRKSRFTTLNTVRGGEREIGNPLQHRKMGAAKPWGREKRGGGLPLLINRTNKKNDREREKILP